MVIPRSAAAALLAEQSRKTGRVVESVITKGPIIHKPAEMNATERAYAEHLEMLRRAGEVAWYAFEPVKLLLAPGLSFTPDFIVVVLREAKVERIEVAEVKGGYVREDSEIKFKVAAEKFPWIKFRMVQRVGREWRVIREAN